MAQTTFNISVDDLSPQIIYSPTTSASFVSQPDLPDEWDVQFSGSGFASVPGELGVGESLHVTQKDGASFLIDFTGSAIYIFGQAVRSTFSLSLDNQSTLQSSFAIDASTSSDSNSSILLTQITGLSEGNHTLLLTAHIPTLDDDPDVAQFIFDQALITVPTNLSNAAVSTKAISDADMQFIGSWSNETDPSLIPFGDNSFHITQTAGDFATYTFQGSSVSVTGLLNSTAGLFNVSLTSNSRSPIVENQQLTGFSPFLSYSTLFLATGLDPNTSHTLTITNVENRSLALNGLNVTFVSGGTALPSEMPSGPSSSQGSLSASSKHGLSQGAIAGLTIGIAVILVLIITALVFLYDRRRRRLRWWRGQGDTSYTGDAILDPPRHRRVQPGSLVDTVHRRPGQGLDSPSPKALSYDYRSIARGDDGMMAEIERGDEGDSDVGHGYSQKKSIASLYTTEVPRDTVDATATAADTKTTTTKHHRESTQSVTRWSTIFGSPTRSSFRRSQIVSATDTPPDVPILAPAPQRVLPPMSVLTKERMMKDSSNRRSSSLSSIASDNFLDLPRSSPFAVEFGHGTSSSERSSERRVHRQRSRSFAEGTVGHTATNALTSFLDFASSAASSFRGSSRSRSRKRQSGSSRSGVSKRTGTHRSQRSRRTQHTSSSSGGASTGVWTLTLSVDRSGSYQGSPRSQPPALQASPHTHPFALSPTQQQPESPTDSVPMSVSDINFRVDDDDDDAFSNRTGRFLPRHPPLPETPLSFTFASISPSDSQHRLPGSASSINENRQPYIAQTVIGRRLAEARAQGHESGSNSAAGSRNGSPRMLTHNHSGSILSIISDRRLPSRSRSRNTSFMNFGRGGGS